MRILICRMKMMIILRWPRVQSLLYCCCLRNEMLFPCMRQWQLTNAHTEAERASKHTDKLLYIRRCTHAQGFAMGQSDAQLFETHTLTHAYMQFQWQASGVTPGAAQPAPKLREKWRAFECECISNAPLVSLDLHSV